MTDAQLRRRDYRLGRQYMRELVKYHGRDFAVRHHLYDARVSIGINPAHLSYVIGESDALLELVSK